MNDSQGTSTDWMFSAANGGGKIEAEQKLCCVREHKIEN